VPDAIAYAEKRLACLERSSRTEEVEEHLVGLVDSIGDSKYLLSVRGLSYITVARLPAELGPFVQYTTELVRFPQLFVISPSGAMDSTDVIGVIRL